jgi:hypothetical protein
MRIAILILVASCQVTTTDNFVNPPPGPPATCATVAAMPGCDQGSVAYSCAGDRPDDGDADLVCSNGTPGALGATLYCCAPISQYYTQCIPDTTITNCSGVAIGFACSGGVTPSDADPTIACSAELGGDGEYCCNTAQPIETCAVDPSVTCAGVAVGYSCADGSTPPLPSGFACTQNGSEFCCSPTQG